MKKKLKRMVAFLLVVVTVFSLSTPCFAAENNSYIATVPEDMVGLDEYIVREEDGTLSMDEVSAENAGYPKEMVEGVSKHLDSMNELVLAGIAVTDSNFTAYAVTGRGRSTRASIPADGERGLVSYWWGRTDYYLLAEDARDMYTMLHDAGNNLMNLFSAMDEYTAHVNNNIYTAAVNILAGLGLTAFAYENTIRSVSNNGTRGIIESNSYLSDANRNVVTFLER